METIEVHHRSKRNVNISSENNSIDVNQCQLIEETEFEPRNDEKLEKNIAQSTDVTRENDVDDYTDEIFNYLDDKDNLHSVPLIVDTSTVVSSSNLVEKNVKTLLCAFCPFFARNVQEFQMHIAKHTEKNFRCLLCNCMYKYRRDCVTHMKRKHSTTVNGSLSQYIQKITNATNTASSTLGFPLSNPTTNLTKINMINESKRYGCPYCPLMTKSTSSIYKHQSRKHASYPKIVHKYSTDDATERNLIAVLKQKPVKNQLAHRLSNSESPKISINGVDPSNGSSSSTSLAHSSTESHSVKYIISQQVRSSTGQRRKLYRCNLCNFRAKHRIHINQHVKQNHSVDHLNPTKIENNIGSDDESNGLIIADAADQKHQEQRANYSLETTVRAPLIPKRTSDSDSSTKAYADIHLSINLFLPKSNRSNSFEETIDEWSSNEEHNSETLSDDEETSTNRIADDENNNDDDDDDDDDDDGEIKHSTPLTHFVSGSLYKPHKCRRCFYRSNWKTDMLHHIRLKHQLSQANKSDYVSMDFHSALQTFSVYEKTFGKVLKNRLLLPKIEYTNCTWEELKSKLFLSDDFLNAHGEPAVSEQNAQKKNVSLQSISSQ